MVMAARRAYASAKRLTRAARPGRIAHGTLARRAFGSCFLAGIVILGAIALVSPTQFGQPGSATLHTGWPSLVLLALMAVAVLIGIVRRRRLLWFAARVREPLARPLVDAAGFDDAVDALEACPAAVRTRYALSWVWGPVVWAVLGGTCAFSTAYFLIDAVLARFRIGWGQPVYAIVFAALGMTVFAAAAGRLATWRFATSVHKEVTTGYPA